MCRRNHLQGCVAAAFGLGLLIGSCLDAHFWCCCLGICLIVVGLIRLKKK